MQSRITRENVLDALLMAVWRRKPALPVTVNSDQGGQDYHEKLWDSFIYMVHGALASPSTRLFIGAPGRIIRRMILLGAFLPLAPAGRRR